MPDKSGTDSEYVIVGGGIAGLATAIAFQQLGLHFTLFEQTKVLRGIGAGFGLAANAMQALEILGLRSEIEKIGHHVDHYNILDEKGNILISPDTHAIAKKYKQSNFTVHRSDLHLFLLSKIDNQHLILGKKAIRVEPESEQVTLHFEDGTTHTSRYLIVADGVKSLLRQQLVPSSTPRYAGYTCWRATIDNQEIQLDKGTETWGKAGRFGMTPLTNNRIYWYACVNANPDSPIFQKYTIDELVNHFGHYHSPIPNILRHTKNEDLIWGDIMDIKPLKNLAYENIVFIGDAGHATTPNMGQGACQALEDAAVLMDEVRHQKNIQDAFLSFEKRRLSRTKYITDTSKLIGDVAQWENNLAIRMRNSVIRLMPPKIVQKSLDKLLSIDFMTLNNKQYAHTSR